MISRKGTRTSDASSGVIQILREAGSGPVVTAGSVVSGLERMFMVVPPLSLFVIPDGPRRGPIRNLEVRWTDRDSGFASSMRPGMTVDRVFAHLTRPPRWHLARRAPARGGRRSG